MTEQEVETAIETFRPRLRLATGVMWVLVLGSMIWLSWRAYAVTFQVRDLLVVPLAYVIAFALLGWAHLSVTRPFYRRLDAHLCELGRDGE